VALATFDTIVSGTRAAVTDRSAADRRELFGENAARIYRLESALLGDSMPEARSSRLGNKLLGDCDDLT
jgi:hypothetical protein